VGEAPAPADTLQPATCDAVLVQGPWAPLQRYVQSPDIIAVTLRQSVQRVVPLGHGAKRALVILGAMIALLSTGLVPRRSRGCWRAQSTRPKSSSGWVRRQRASGPGMSAVR